MSWTSLSEFKRMTSLPDSVLLWLLSHNKLPCRTSAQLGIEINTKDVGVDELARLITQAATHLEDDLNRELVERCGAILAEELGAILEEAERKA